MYGVLAFNVHSKQVAGCVCVFSSFLNAMNQHILIIFVMNTLCNLSNEAT